MPGQYTGNIVNFEVNEKKPRGQVTFNILTATPIPGTSTPPDFGPSPPVRVFKLDEDSTETFSGLAHICAAAKALALIGFILPVRIQVLTGAADEIDTLTI